MKISHVVIMSLLGLIVFGKTLAAAGGPSEQKASSESSKLMVLWTSGDREVALKMVFMYTLNAKKQGWWDEIRFVIWGPSSKLLSEDTELQQAVKQMKKTGVELLACKACSDSYGVSDKLTSLGVEVKYMGVPLTEMLKSDWTSLTF